MSPEGLADEKFRRLLAQEIMNLRDQLSRLPAGDKRSKALGFLVEVLAILLSED